MITFLVTSPTRLAPWTGPLSGAGSGHLPGIPLIESAFSKIFLDREVVYSQGLLHAHECEAKKKANESLQRKRKKFCYPLAGPALKAGEKLNEKSNEIFKCARRSLSLSFVGTRRAFLSNSHFLGPQHEQKMVNGDQHVNGMSNGHHSDKHKSSSHKSSSKDKHRDKDRSKDHKSSKSSHR